MSSRSVPGKASERTADRGERTTAGRERSTGHEERTASSSEGTSRPRLLDAITLVSLGYIIRDRYGSFGQTIGSWTDGPPEQVRDVIRKQTEEVTREAVDQFLNSSQSMAERAEETTESAADRIEEGSERVGETIQDSGKGAGEKLKQGGEEVSETLEEGRERVNEKREPEGKAN